jgi:hypothetical protein
MPPVISSTAAKFGMSCLVALWRAPSRRSRTSTSSTVGADLDPEAVSVFSTGARTGSGTAIVRPGLRARNCARRRRRSKSSIEPAKTVPAPVRPSRIQDALGASSTDATCSDPLPTGAKVRVAGAGRVMAGEGATGWGFGTLWASAADPPWPEAGSAFSGFGPGDLVEVAAPGTVKLQPTSITLGSKRWAPPGWAMASESWKISG